MTQLDAPHIERSATEGLGSLGIGREREGSLRVDKAPNEPGAGSPIDMRMRPSDPEHAWILPPPGRTVPRARRSRHSPVPRPRTGQPPGSSLGGAPGVA